MLDGARNAYRDIAAFNAAAGLVVAGAAPDLRSGVERAQEALDTGAARGALDKLVAASNA